MTEPHVISLGAGVQSTAMALMAAHGEIEPMPTAAIFADTGWEPAHVYDNLERLRPLLPFPIHVVDNGNIRDDLMRSRMRGVKAEGVRWISPPLFTLDAEGNGGMIRRQCTEEYKLKPIRRKQRELLGLAKGERANGHKLVSWIGISLDEVQRMKPSRDAWAENRWPLIELGMRRGDCLRWLESKGYPLPGRSACIGCPFRSDAEWRSLSAAEFEDACQVDEYIRGSYGKGTKWGKDMRDAVYLHAARIPLREVDLSTAEDHGQVDMFGNECFGMCGV